LEKQYELGTTFITKTPRRHKRLRIEQDDTRLGFEVIMIVLFSRQLLEVYKIKPIIPLSKDFAHAFDS
jgi:hypothetical protein